MKTRITIYRFLLVVIAISFKLSAYANDYKKETKLIPGVVFKSDKKVKDNILSGMGILTLTEKGGYVPLPAISVEGNFAGDTIYNGKAEDMFFLRYNATGTFTYRIEFDKQNKTTRLDIKQIDGLLNGYPVKDVPVITYIEDKNLHVRSIQVAASSFVSPICQDIPEHNADLRSLDGLYTLRAFPTIPIKSIAYSMAVETDGGFSREKVRLDFSPKYITTLDDVNIIMRVNPEPEFYIGNSQDPKAYCKLKYNYNDLEKMVVRTADGKATITLLESKRNGNYSDAINKWNIKFSDGNVYVGSLNGTDNLSSLLSYKEPNCEVFLNMMVAISKIKATEIPLYDGILTFSNGKTENYNKGVSDTQLAATLNQKPVVINLDAPGTLLSVISPSELEKTISITVSGLMNEDDAKVLTELGQNIRNLNLQNCLIINPADGTGMIPMNFMNGRTKLKSVIFPENLKSIEDFAFQNCTSLEEVILPQSLKYMNNKLWAGEDGTPFRGCTSLKRLIFNGSVLNNKLELPSDIATNLKELRFAGTTDGSAVGYYHGIHGTVRDAKVYIPASIKSDLGGTFENCEIFFESAKAPESTYYLKLHNCTIHIPKGSTTSYYSKFGNMNFIESDYPQPNTEDGNNSKMNTSNKSNSTVNLNFTLFQELSSKSTDEVLEYLKQHGCKIEYSSEVFSTKVRGGYITIYPPRISYPRMGVGPVEFFTDDPKVCQAWRTGLKKAGYGEFGKKDIWDKERMVYGCPTFGIADFIDCDVEDDYSGVATLYIKHFYED